MNLSLPIDSWLPFDHRWILIYAWVYVFLFLPVFIVYLGFIGSIYTLFAFGVKLPLEKIIR